MASRKEILEVLNHVLDPKSGKPIFQAGLLTNIELKENDVNIELTFPEPNVPYKQELNFACVNAINTKFPDLEVNIHVISGTVKNQESSTPLPQVKNIIAVASGKGGVGKSTISANLAISLSKEGHRVGLIDADLYGPSMPTMFGLQGERPRVSKIHGQNKLNPIEKYGVHLISIGFIVEPDQAVVLRGPRLSGVLKQFINDCIWPDLDYLIIDLPPGTGDIQLTLVQTLPVTGAIIVTTPQAVAIADAIKATNMFLLPNVNVPVLGVVENMSWFTPADHPEEQYFIFGKGGGEQLVKQSKSMLLGQIPLIQGIRESGDEGQPAAIEGGPLSNYFQKIARNTINQIVIRNDMMNPTKIVDVST